MSAVRREVEVSVVAILCSDIHLCHSCPPARAAEPNWYEAMGRVLDQVRQLAEDHNAPILCAGDVFDRWNSPPELINFAIRRMPHMFAVPGQHDLPHHSLEDIRRSAFWTLVEMETISYQKADGFCVIPTMRIFPFPWGKELTSQDEGDEGIIKVALCHRYVWCRGSGYPGASKEGLVGNLGVRGYDVMVFGDNHQTFETVISPTNRTLVVNPGCLIRRKQDERQDKPSVYCLLDDATVERIQLDTSQDRWTDPDESASEPWEGMQDFVDELRNLDADSLDFEQAINLYCTSHNVNGRVQRFILESMEKNR